MRRRPGGRLLVIDDDQAVCRLISATFAAEGIEVISAHEGVDGLAKAAGTRPDVVLLDVRLPGMHGLQVLEQLKATSSDLPVLMLTASNDVKTAVSATQLGAFDYLTKPFDTEEIVVAVRRALETRALRLEVDELRTRVGNDEAANLGAQMGVGPQVAQVVGQVRLVGASNFTVLLLGETGTGKELVAQALHRQGVRRRHPFIALDCGAIPEQLLESELFGHERGAFTGAERRRTGRFQLAEGGTCFLDEIGNLHGSLQAKLLRVLESKQVQPVGAERASPVDVRFIAATNHDLQSRANAGTFRADLFFRLAQYTISLPPLRHRVDDIPYLAQRFVEEAGVELRRPVQALAPAALALLKRHPWPGNVRELRNVVRQAVLRTTGLVIQPADLQGLFGADPPPPSAAVAGTTSLSLKAIANEAVRVAERQAICDVLRRTHGNKSQAAQLLQTDYKTLHLKIKRLGIRAQDFKA